MKTQGIGASGTASVKRVGLAYKVGLGVVMTGVAIVASSWLLGGVVFAAATALLNLLGAPESRQLLPPHEPEAGKQLLQFFGVVLFVCGACIFSLRLVGELLGLAGHSELISRLRGSEKLGSGAAAVGFLVGVSCGVSQVLLYEIFPYEYGTGALMSILETVGYAGGVIFLGGLAVLILGAPNRRRTLLGWTDRMGWGKLGCGLDQQAGARIDCTCGGRGDPRVRGPDHHNRRGRDWHPPCWSRASYPCRRAAVGRSGSFPRHHAESIGHSHD